MVKCCETCGHPMLDFELQIGLTPRQRHIYLALQKAGQRGLDIEELIEKVYSGEEDGGPVTAPNVIHVQKLKMREKLAAFGLQITTTKGHGSRWRLEKINV